MPSPVLICQSPAKLNLFLHITGRRPDGYHQLQTLFQLVSLYDTLEFRTADAPPGVIALRCDQTALPLDNNLVIRAAQALRTAAGNPDLSAQVRLVKRIPTGGGLGGGSSNAAVTLLALNTLWNLGMTPAELADLGVRLGADVPVFVHGRTALATGIGEQLEYPTLPLKHYLIVWPRIHVATADIFSHPELTRDSPAIKIADFLAGRGRNDCEKVVRRRYPEVAAALDWLGQFRRARLTGTGSCVFAEFETVDEAGELLEKVPARFKGFVASGLERMPDPVLNGHEIGDFFA